MLTGVVSGPSLQLVFVLRPKFKTPVPVDVRVMEVVLSPTNCRPNVSLALVVTMSRVLYEARFRSVKGPV